MNYKTIHTSDEVTPLRSKHARRASKSWQKAFKDDPMFEYLAAHENKGPIVKCLDRIAMSALISFYCKKRIGLTVNGGEAYITALPADAPYLLCKGPVDWVYHTILNAFSRLISNQIFGTKEQHKRFEEAEKKYGDATELAFGGDEVQMFEVMYLATDPDCQGRGHGGALLDKIIEMANDQGKGIWLNSSNANNTHFYESHGFRVAAEYKLGDQNQEWIALNRDPVVVRLMVRDPCEKVANFEDDILLLKY